MKVTLEYRGHVAENYSFSDKDTGKKVEGVKCTLHCEDPETGEAVSLRHPIARTVADASQIKLPYKKGEKITVDLVLDKCIMRG